jgi:hypothetical protein
MVSFLVAAELSGRSENCISLNAFECFHWAAVVGR